MVVSEMFSLSHIFVDSWLGTKGFGTKLGLLHFVAQNRSLAD